MPNGYADLSYTFHNHRSQLPLQSIQMFHLCARMPCVPPTHSIYICIYMYTTCTSKSYFLNAKSIIFSVREQQMLLICCFALGCENVISLFPAGKRTKSRCTIKLEALERSLCSVEPLYRCQTWNLSLARWA